MSIEPTGCNILFNLPIPVRSIEFREPLPKDLNFLRR